MCGCGAGRVAAGKGCDVDVVRCVHNGQVWGSVRGRGRAAREVGRLVSFCGWAIVPRGGRGCPIGQRRLSCCLLCVPCLRVHRASEMSAGGRVMIVFYACDVQSVSLWSGCGVRDAVSVPPRRVRVSAALSPPRASGTGGIRIVQSCARDSARARPAPSLAGCGVGPEHLTEPAGGSVGRAGGVPVGTGVRNKDRRVRFNLLWLQLTRRTSSWYSQSHRYGQGRRVGA